MHARDLPSCFDNLPEILPLDVSLFEYSVVGVDHPGPEHAEENDDDSELVDSPHDVARHVRNLLFDLTRNEKTN